MKKKRKYGKQFKPEFRPMYIDVIAIDNENNYHRLNIIKNVEYDSGQIRVYVEKI